MSVMDNHVADLLDLLQGQQQVTKSDMQQQLGGLSKIRVDQVIREIRLRLADDDTINLTCTPNGWGNEWLYELVGTINDAKWWVANRLGDSETRLETIEAIMRSLVSGSNGRTTDGRKCRLIERALRRLREDLADVDLIVDGIGP